MDLQRLVGSSECLTAAPKRQIVAPDCTRTSTAGESGGHGGQLPFVVAVAVVAVTSAGVAQSRRPQPTDTERLRFRLTCRCAIRRSHVRLGLPAQLSALRGRAGQPSLGWGWWESRLAYFVEDDPPGCAAGQVRVLPTTVRLAVKDKGEIQVQVGGTGCLDRIHRTRYGAEEAFTVTGGSGKYAGATGGRQLSAISYGPAENFGGKDTWDRHAEFPGLSFDLTPPTLTAPSEQDDPCFPTSQAHTCFVRGSDTMTWMAPSPCCANRDPEAGSPWVAHQSTARRPTQAETRARPASSSP